ncbi:MAG: cupin domain-containing protein [Salinibacter sp.]
MQTQTFADDGQFPNNETLPVVLLRGALAPEEGAETYEQVFRAHEWRGQWRNGIFSYHHYHSTAHEVLGIAQGSARVQLGGPSGEAFAVAAGDVVVLPAGVAHKNLGADADFLVVGAYSDGQQWDLKRGRPEERPEADRNIERVPLPSTDPVYGDGGPLIEHWPVSP